MVLKYTSEDDAVIEVITKFSKFKIFKEVVLADKLLTDRSYYPDTLSFFSQAGESFYLCFYRTWNEESALVKWEINKRVPEQGESPLTAMALPLDQKVNSDNDFKGEKWYHFKSDTSGILSFKYGL